MGFKELNHQGRSSARAHEDLEGIARTLVDAGLTVHRNLGPGLLESANEHCLAYELQKRGLEFQRQVALPIVYDGKTIDAGYRLDLLVENLIIVEVKSIDALTRVHEAQILTYLKLSSRRIGFLMNFNVPLFKQGVKRFVL